MAVEIKASSLWVLLMFDLERSSTGAWNKTNPMRQQQRSQMAILKSPQIILERATMKSANLTNRPDRNAYDVSLEESDHPPRTDSLRRVQVSQVVCQLHVVDLLPLSESFRPETETPRVWLH